MQPGPIRRFTIADMMILVAASAVGTLILRSYLPGYELLYGIVRTDYPSNLRPLWRVEMWLYGPASCLVVPWMASLILLRLMRPRPTRARLAGQPGFVACVAVVASLLPGLAWIASIQHRPGFQRAFGFQQGWNCALSWTSTAVAGAWIALALTRRWRPEPSWIDRLGRALGAYWVVVLVGGYALEWCNGILKLLAKWGES